MVYGTYGEYGKQYMEYACCQKEIDVIPLNAITITQTGSPKDIRRMEEKKMWINMFFFTQCIRLLCYLSTWEGPLSNINLILSNFSNWLGFPDFRPQKSQIFDDFQILRECISVPHINATVMSLVMFPKLELVDLHVRQERILLLGSLFLFGRIQKYFVFCILYFVFFLYFVFCIL